MIVAKPSGPIAVEGLSSELKDISSDLTRVRLTTSQVWWGAPRTVGRKLGRIWLGQAAGLCQRRWQRFRFSEALLGS